MLVANKTRSDSILPGYQLKCQYNLFLAIEQTAICRISLAIDKCD